MRRVESRFTVTYGHAQPNANKEALYAQHKARFKGFIHNTLTDYLSAGFQGTVFDTREVCVYDGDRLIAVSYFDLGEQSMASLLGLYDESYSKYSLGTYTLLKEAEYGKRTGRKWFYPGYIWTTLRFRLQTELGPMEHYREQTVGQTRKLQAGEHHLVPHRKATEELTAGLKTLGLCPKPGCIPTSAWATWSPWVRSSFGCPFLLRLVTC